MVEALEPPSSLFNSLVRELNNEQLRPAIMQAFLFYDILYVQIYLGGTP